MEQNAQHIDRDPHWVLYDGTSTARLKQILKDGRLRRATVGDQKIALTTERSVAEYFASNAVFADKHDRPDGDSSGVVLVLEGEALLADNYNLIPFSDPIWGDGECDWENEIECWDDIDPLDEVLIAIEPVPAERCRELAERGRAAVEPPVPTTASFELTVMADTIGKLAEDEITQADADAVARALGHLRSALELTRDTSKHRRTEAAER
jgi:hypothetical protein